MTKIQNCYIFIFLKKKINKFISSTLGRKYLKEKFTSYAPQHLKIKKFLRMFFTLIRIISSLSSFFRGIIDDIFPLPHTQTIQVSFVIALDLL